MDEEIVSRLNFLMETMTPYDLKGNATAFAELIDSIYHNGEEGKDEDIHEECCRISLDIMERREVTEEDITKLRHLLTILKQRRYENSTRCDDIIG
jgi:hypothetical protein